MIIIVLNLVLALIEAPFLLNIGTKKAGKILYLSVIFIQLIIIHAFLDPYKMPDLPGYLTVFKLVSEHSLDYCFSVGFPGVKMEEGWIIMCKGLSLIANEYSLLIATSLIMVGAVCYSAYKYSPYVWFTIFLWLCTYFNQSLFVLRQHTAMAICLFSIPFIIRREFIKFIIVIAIAYSIHRTSLIFLPIYFLYGMRISWSFLAKMCVVTIICSYASQYAFGWLFENTWYGSYADLGEANYTVFLMGLSSLLLFLLSKNWRLDNLTSVEKVFFIILCMYVSLALVGIHFVLTNRLGKYFGLAILFIHPLSISNFRSPIVKFIATVCVMICYILLFISGTIGSANSVYFSGYTNTVLNLF